MNNQDRLEKARELKKQLDVNDFVTCANDDCSIPADIIIDGTCTAICRRCATVYEWGQADPDGALNEIEDIDEYIKELENDQK